MEERKSRPDGTPAQGTTSVADDDFAVTVRHLPAGRPGLFFFGDAQVQTPFGDGYRCVAGNVLRARPFAHADAAGVATRAVALSGSPIVPGSTWNFQLWYRDSGPSGFNLSDALELTFCPYGGPGKAWGGWNRHDLT